MEAQSENLEKDMDKKGIKSMCEKNKLETFNPDLYGFQYIDKEAKPKLLELNKYNAELVEYMIRNNSSYVKSFNKDSAPDKKKDGELNEKGYSGSSAYWLTKFKEKLEKNDSEYDYETIIKYSVIAIDSENSTHLNSDGCGREEISNRISLEIKTEDFKKLLQNDNKKYDLLKTISEETNPEKYKTKDEDEKKLHKPRENFSFATKFCHYASYYLFEGNEQYQYGYSIYDGVMSEAVGAYAKHFGVPYRKFNKKDNSGSESGENLVQFYKDYQNTIDKILKENVKKTGNKINRREFDHLLWYYYKAHMEELKEE